MHLSIEQLPCIVAHDVVVPCFMSDADHPWLQRLIERCESAVGMRAADVDEHLLAPLFLPAPPAKHRLAAYVLSRGFAYRTQAPLDPAAVRDAVFAAASSPARSRAEVLADVATAMGATADDVEASLFADLPSERAVVGLVAATSPAQLAADANTWLAQAFVSRATRVRIEVVGASRALVHGAKMRGLLCSVHGGEGAAAVLDLSGPMSLFKRTRLYGRALAGILRTLPWCDRWRLEADCVYQNRVVAFRLSTGAPIAAGDGPTRFDSKVEETFAVDMAKRAPEWGVVREPKPVVVGGGLLFPDFALTAPDGTTFVVEIVGFWTPAYLVEKLARYRAARLANLVLCVDETLACGDAVFPDGARVVPFRRKVDVGRVIEACGYPAPPRRR